MSAKSVNNKDKSVVATSKRDNRVTIPKWAQGLAGSCGGLIEALALQPLDVAKTRLQLDNVGKYKGVGNAFSTIVKEEGPKALYKGLTPFVAHLTFKYALRMYSFEMFNTFLQSKNGENSHLRTMLAGLGAGLLEAVVIVTPFEVVKMRLQAQHGMDASLMKYTGPLDALKKIVKNEGPQALLKGCSATMIRQGSNQATSFWAYHTFNEKVWGKKRGDGVQLNQHQMIMSGGFAGALGPMVNCPADVVKTRMQCQETIAGVKPKYTGFMNCLTTVAKEEGPAALYKGLSVRLARIAPGQAIMWTVVTNITTWFEQQELKRMGLSIPQQKTNVAL